MTTMLETVVPKSDQLNADDLMGGQTKTIKITNITIAMGEQPVSIHYEGDNGKPYKPGKSMRRVLIHCWGADANKYIGRSLTLYRDDKVKFGGADVGGVRISYMSDIPEQVTIALTTTRAQRKPFTVRPLSVVSASTEAEYMHAILTAPTEGLKEKFDAAVKSTRDEAARRRFIDAKDKRKKELTS